MTRRLCRLRHRSIQNGFGRRFLDCTRPGRQEDLECGAAPDLGDRVDEPPELLHDAIAGRQTQPGALAFRLGGEERLEDLLEDFRRNAAAVINDFNQHIVAVSDVNETILARRSSIRPRGPDQQAPATALLDHGVARIGAKIGHHRFQLALVGANARQVAAVDDVQLDALIDDVAQQRVVVRQRIGDVEDFGNERLLAREGQHGPDQLRATRCKLVDRLELVKGGIARWMADLELVHVEDDPQQHVVELVRQTARHVAKRLKLLALRQSLFQVTLLGRVDDIGCRRPALPVQHHEHVGRTVPAACELERARAVERLGQFLGERGCSLVGHEKIGKARTGLRAARGHFDQCAVCIQHHGAFNAFTIKPDNAKRRIGEHGVVNAARRSAIFRAACRSSRRCRAPHILFGSIRHIDDRAGQRIAALARPGRDQRRRCLHPIARAQDHFGALARLAAHFTLHQLEAFRPHYVFKPQGMLAIGKSQHLAQRLVDVNDAVVAPRREEAHRRIFHIERTRIDGSAPGHCSTRLDLAQPPQRTRLAQRRNAGLELRRRQRVAEQKRRQKLRTRDPCLGSLRQAVDRRSHARVGRKQAVDRGSMRAVTDFVGQLRQFLIGLVGGDACPAPVGDQCRFVQRFQPDMAPGRLRRRLGRATLGEHAQLAARATHGPEHKHQRHGRQRDDQHGTRRPDRVLPCQRHARGRARDDQG